MNKGPSYFLRLLEALLLKVKELSLFKGLKMGEGKQVKEVIHLFFTDDTSMFCKLDTGAVINLIYVLLYFQAVSGKVGRWER